MKELEEKLKIRVLNAIVEDMPKEKVKKIMQDYVLEYRKHEPIKQEMEDYLNVVGIYLKYMRE
jgi:hypothetical protein